MAQGKRQKVEGRRRKREGFKKESGARSQESGEKLCGPPREFQSKIQNPKSKRFFSVVICGSASSGASVALCVKAFDLFTLPSVPSHHPPSHEATAGQEGGED